MTTNKSGHEDISDYMYIKCDRHVTCYMYRIDIELGCICEIERAKTDLDHVTIAVLKHEGLVIFTSTYTCIPSLSLRLKSIGHLQVVLKRLCRLVNSKIEVSL